MALAGRARCARRRPARAPRRGCPRARGSPPGGSGSSRIEVAFSFPPAQPRAAVEQLGPRQAEQQDRRVAGEVRHVLDRSRKVASAHWRSSSTTTSGRRSASTSNSRRAAQKIFSAGYPPESPSPIASREHVGDQVRLGVVRQLAASASRTSAGAPLPASPARSRTTSVERPVGDALAVGEAAAAQHGRRVAEPAGELVARGATSRRPRRPARSRGGSRGRSPRPRTRLRARPAAGCARPAAT